MKAKLSASDLRDAVRGEASAFRRKTEFQPAGGSGDKVFPPTFAGGKYAVEQRRIEDAIVDCVLLDSVPSQANRMEMALLDAYERKMIILPMIAVDFSKTEISDIGRITSLEAPHRIADAILRDSLLNGKRFRESEYGSRLDTASIRNATPLFEICPTALLFGMWDSTGPKGGSGAKFERAIVSEIIGIGSQIGVKTSSRIDPLQIMKEAGPLFLSKDGGWTLSEKDAVRDNKKSTLYKKTGRPSEAVHGNIVPTIAEGGVTLKRAQQTTVLSLAALRHLRFPIDGKLSDKAEDAARTVLAALGLCASTLANEKGCDLRSRCLLVPTESFTWEILGTPESKPQTFTISGKDSLAIYEAAVKDAIKEGLPWREKEIVLQPMPDLVELVRRSRELAATQASEED